MEKTHNIVLITGGTGFIAVHTIVKCLTAGYLVRTSLRNMTRQDEVKKMVLQAGVPENLLTHLTFVKGDLTVAKDWEIALKNVTYVIHIASPTPTTRPKDGHAMVKMAIDGVRNVFSAAKKAHVKRIVMTSASGAVLSGHKNHPEKFTEQEWTNLDGAIDAYQRSKTRAEQEAFKFALDNDMELVTILPTTVMGPILGPDFSHSQMIIKNMLEGKSKHLIKLSFDIVDVRDVAQAHVLALTQENIAGERFLITSGDHLSFKQVAHLLKDEFKAQAPYISTKEVPDWIAIMASWFIVQLRMPVKLLGQNTACSNEKARKMLGLTPLSAKTALLATAHSMFDLNIIRNNQSKG